MNISCFEIFMDSHRIKIFYYTDSSEKSRQTFIIHEIKWNVNLMQIGTFIDVFLARQVSGTYDHHQEH